MKRFVLMDHLTNTMWVGIFIIAMGVMMVGLSSMIGHKNEVKEGVNPSFGLICCFFGTLMQSVQYCYEEKATSGPKGDCRVDARAVVNLTSS